MKDDKYKKLKAKQKEQLEDSSGRKFAKLPSKKVMKWHEKRDRES